MAKLSEIAFSKTLQKEFNIGGHKVVFRTLTTDDNLKLSYIDERADDNKSMGYKDSILATVEILSLVLVSVDGVVNEDVADAAIFLRGLSPADFAEFFKAYQTLNPTIGEIEKNS
jgi:hypothetical protein